MAKESDAARYHEPCNPAVCEQRWRSYEEDQGEIKSSIGKVLEKIEGNGAPGIKGRLTQMEMRAEAMKKSIDDLEWWWKRIVGTVVVFVLGTILSAMLNVKTLTAVDMIAASLARSDKDQGVPVIQQGVRK